MCLGPNKILHKFHKTTLYWEKVLQAFSVPLANIEVVAYL